MALTKELLNLGIDLSAISKQYLRTMMLCQEVGMSCTMLDRLRKAGVLLPDVHNHRLHGSRSPLFWRVNAVVQAVRCRTACLES